MTGGDGGKDGRGRRERQEGREGKIEDFRFLIWKSSIYNSQSTIKADIRERSAGGTGEDGFPLETAGMTGGGLRGGREGTAGRMEAGRREGRKRGGGKDGRAGGSGEGCGQMAGGAQRTGQVRRVVIRRRRGNGNNRRVAVGRSTRRARCAGRIRTFPVGPRRS